MKHKTILLVEDDYLDVTSVKRELSKIGVPHNLYVAHNGVDALALLNGNSPDGIKIKPDIILLDINMPKMNGIEFLTIIKNYFSLKSIKVFVMTTSSEEYDRSTSENLGITGYILKPLNFGKSNATTQASPVLRLLEELMS